MKLGLESMKFSDKLAKIPSLGCCDDSQPVDNFLKISLNDILCYLQQQVVLHGAQPSSCLVRASIQGI